MGFDNLTKAIPPVGPGEVYGTVNVITDHPNNGGVTGVFVKWASGKLVPVTAITDTVVGIGIRSKTGAVDVDDKDQPRMAVLRSGLITVDANMITAVPKNGDGLYMDPNGKVSDDPNPDTSTPPVDQNVAINAQFVAEIATDVWLIHYR
ncbi:MAG TPA: hypothetical protein PLC97_11640 [Myxococcota bacterium]|nr:hypothetical protein [Myxococcota bacterium]